MTEKDNESAKPTQRFLSRLVFAPEPAVTKEPPNPDDSEFAKKWEAYNQYLTEQKTFHDEASKTVRRVFYTLTGTCLFCVITLAGSKDVQLLSPQAIIKLPILNYEIGFLPFLIVGPVVLIALTIYLHIFLGQHRALALAPKSRLPILPNFDSWTAKLVMLIIFYWMVPITLAIFAWKAWPVPRGQTLFFTSLGVAGGLVLLQIRRCPPGWRKWGLPLLITAFVIFGIGLGVITNLRILNLFKADLSGQDLRKTNLYLAFLRESNLNAANLTMAVLYKADLSGADLSGADLSGAVLYEADLSGANLSWAYLSGAYLSGAYLSGADLSGADLSGADLSGANLYEADLNEADLSWADLSDVKNLTCEQVESAVGKPKALPDYIPESCKPKEKRSIEKGNEDKSGHKWF